MSNVSLFSFVNHYEFISFSFPFESLIGVYRQTIFDTNHIQYTQSLLHNKELRTKCHILQDKIDHLERNNIHLIQRLTQKVTIKLFF